MGEPQHSTEEAALWRRWRSAAGPDAPVALDPLLLAAYAENRLAAAEIDRVEEWLAANPAAVEDILAARRAAHSGLPDSPPALVARATALLHHGDGQAQVFAFRRPVPRWRAVATWSCMAASMLIAGVVGFNLGSDVYASLAGASSGALGQELLDPSGFLTNADEDSAT
jgi:hypothetical protein